MANIKPLSCEVKPEWYVGAIVASFVPLLVSLVLWLIGWGIHIDDTHTVHYGMLLFVPSLLYNISSIRFIATEDLAGVTVLEVPAHEQAEGFLYAPRFLTKVFTLPRSLRQSQFPGEPEQIAKVSDEEADRMRSDLLRPIRITTGPAEGIDDDPLDARLTMEPTFTVTWQLELDQKAKDGDGGLFEFLINIPGRTWTQKVFYILKMMRDTGENALNIALSKHSAAWVNSHKQQIIDDVEDRIESKVTRWGILIDEVNVLGLDPDHDTNKSLAKIPQAKAERQATVEKAEGEKERHKLEAEGKADAMRTIADAQKDVDEKRGEGLAAGATKAGVSVRELMAFDITQTILGNKEGKFVFANGSGIADAVTVGATILETVGDKK